MSGGLTVEAAERFAAEWYEAWNSRELDHILTHYREDVEFTSPFVPAITGVKGATLHGRSALGFYFRQALEAFPTLWFEPLGLFVGVESIALNYRSVNGRLTIELMTLDDNLVVARGSAHYDELP